MANTFKSALVKSAGTATSSVYTVPSAATAILVGCTIANTTNSPVTCDVMIARSGQNYYLVKTAIIPVGSSFVWTGGEQKTVLQASDIIRVVMSADASADVVLSYLEIT